MNKNKFIKLVTLTFVFLIIIGTFGNFVSAEINPNNLAGTAADDVGAIIKGVGSVGLGVLIKPFTRLILFLLMALFALSYLLFSPMSTGGAFPFSDQVIFNKLPFFDVNFLNPTSQGLSPVAMLQGTIKNLYYSLYIVAGAVFLVAIMVIGIKLAIATIATDKAHYKKSLTNWAFGLLLLFLLPMLMAGIFKVNESIVNSASSAVSSNIHFEITYGDMAGGILGLSTGGIGLFFADTFGNFIDSLVEVADGTQMNFSGFGGLILYYFVQAAKGDFSALIICGILLGQSIALIFQYLKRLFYCIILGLIAPVVLAMDIVKQNV